MTLFDPDEEQPRRESPPYPPNGPPLWSRHRVKNPQQCDDCLIVVSHGSEPGPVRHASFIRRRQGEPRYLCTEHAQEWRDHDRKSNRR